MKGSVGYTSCIYRVAVSVLERRNKDRMHHAFVHESLTCVRFPSNSGDSPCTEYVSLLYTPV